MTLRTRLLLAQLPLAFALLGVGVVARRTVDALDHNAQAILKDNHLSVLAGQTMRDDTDALARHALAKSLHQPVTGDPQALCARFERELTFQEGNVTESGERELTARVRDTWTQYRDVIDRLEDDTSAAPSSTSYIARLEPLQIALQRLTAQIVALNQDAMLRKSERAQLHAERMSSGVFAATIAALLVGLLSSLYLTNRLTRPLAVLAQAVRRIAQGDLDARAKLPGRDEVAEVARELNTMAARLAQYRSSSLGELLQAQQASQAAIDSLSDPVLVLHADGGLLAANEAAVRAFGVDTDRPGSEALARVPAEVRRMITEALERLATMPSPQGARGLEDAVPVRLRDESAYFLPRTSAMHGEQGHVVGLTLLFQDVTKLRRFDELKTDLVATVAHEFRTPLTSLRMAIHLCVEGAAGVLSTKQAELLTGAREDCERLQTLVDDILDLSRIQGGRIELHRRTVFSGSIVAQAIDEHRDAARDRGIALVAGTPTIDHPVSADPERIRLVLTNLIVNAIRHTPVGGSVTVRAAPEDGFVRFEVADTGSGIAATHLPQLFDRFFRVPGGSSDGAGLGLFICKEIVSAHGGRIGVASDPGAGALFWFTLPTSS